jgi:hypothetical protein
MNIKGITWAVSPNIDNQLQVSAIIFQYLVP